MKILIVGGGHMGQTFASAFIRAKSKPEDLMILEKSGSGKVEQLQAMQIGTVYTELSCIPLADILIFAVKPQDAKVLFDSMRGQVQKDQILLSIMAGVKTERIQQNFPGAKIVRAMPNLPSKIGLGVTGYTASPNVSRVELSTIHNLLSATGRAIYIDDEDQIDAVTAISGSGPAYLFYFMQSMMEAALDLGLNEAQAELLVGQTILGSINLYQQANLSCREWIEQVASRGGTTEAAMARFEKDQVGSGIQNGLRAACRRARELGA